MPSHLNYSLLQLRKGRIDFAGCEFQGRKEGLAWLTLLL